MYRKQIMKVSLPEKTCMNTLVERLLRRMPSLLGANFYLEIYEHGTRDIIKGISYSRGYGFHQGTRFRNGSPLCLWVFSSNMNSHFVHEAYLSADRQGVVFLSMILGERALPRTLSPDNLVPPRYDR